MKKIKIKMYLLWCVILGIASILTVGCNQESNSTNLSNENQQPPIIVQNTKSQIIDKKSNLDKSIALRLEIDDIKNEQIRDIVEDKKETLQNGIYGCISDTENRYYILINGVGYWYSNISFSIKDKVLTISYNTEYAEGLRTKHLFVIDPNHEETFDKVELINNGIKETFKILYE